MAGNGVSRAYVDSAGGMILVGNPNFYLDGFPVAVEGNPVQSHGDSPHNSAVIVNGTPGFVINGIPVCTTGSQASCGHPATGSSSFSVGSAGRGSESREVPIGPPPFTPLPSGATSPPGITVDPPPPGVTVFPGVTVDRPFFTSQWFPYGVGGYTLSTSTINAGYGVGITLSPGQGYLYSARQEAQETVPDMAYTRFQYVKPLVWLNSVGDAGRGILFQNAVESMALIESGDPANAGPLARSRWEAILRGLSLLPAGMRVLCPINLWQVYLVYDNEPAYNSASPTPSYNSIVVGGTSDESLLNGVPNPRFYDYNFNSPKPVRYPNFDIVVQPSPEGVTWYGPQFTESTSVWDLPDFEHPDYARVAAGSFLNGRASDNLAGVTTFEGTEYKWSVSTPWGQTGADWIKSNWEVFITALKGASAEIDYVTMDWEGGPAVDFFTFTYGPTTPVGRMLMRARVQGILTDPKADLKVFGGDYSFNDVWNLSGLCVSQLQVPGSSMTFVPHPQIAPAYFWWSGAMKTLTASGMNYSIFQPLKERYPNAGFSNYDYWKSPTALDDLVYESGGGHVHGKALQPVGDAQSPVLYGSFGVPFEGSPAPWNPPSNVFYPWVIDPTDSTRIVRDDVYRLYDSTGRPIDRLYNSMWYCFLNDVQQIRGAARGAPDLPIRPWIRGVRVSGFSGFLFGSPFVPPIPRGRELFYYEILRHGVLCGVQHFYDFNQFASTEQDQVILNNLMIELNFMVGGYTPNVMIRDRVDYKGKYLISGAKAIDGPNKDKYVWRVTPRPDVVLLSESTNRLLIPPGSTDDGAWVVTTTSEVPRYVVQ